MAVTPPGVPPDDDDLDSQLSGVIARLRRYVWATIAGLGLLVFVLAAAVIYLLTTQHSASVQNTNQISLNQVKSDKRWCATLTLLTAQPVARPADPASNPSREASYQLYTDFLVLKHEFGCYP